MSVVKPFRGLRPVKKFAEKVASPPYDVLNSEEARRMAKGNPYSFLHVNKPEIDLSPDINIYDDTVYQKGAENLHKLIEDKIYIQDNDPCFYLYRQKMGEHEQTGLVAAASVDEYDQNLIKKHELTRVEKENDRLKHILNLKAQAGPVFLTYKKIKAISDFIKKQSTSVPEYDFNTDDGIQHTFWVVSDEKSVKKIQDMFNHISHLYVADGHHRSAAASRACAELKKQNNNHTGEEPYNYFLTVIFPHDQMYIMDYNRVVKDLNGLSEDAFLEKIDEYFLVREYSDVESYMPANKHDFGMYLNKMWYKLSAIPGTWNDFNPVEKLDVSILYNNVLKTILGIGDPRTDKRIDFVGGIRGMQELENRVDSGEMKIAFSLYPTSIHELMAIADANEIMPPKSTWFEPKLRSGLIIHKLD